MIWVCIIAYLLIGFGDAVLFCRYCQKYYEVVDTMIQIFFWPFAVIMVVAWSVTWLVKHVCGQRMSPSLRHYME